MDTNGILQIAIGALTRALGYFKFEENNLILEVNHDDNAKTVYSRKEKAKPIVRTAPRELPSR